MNLKLYLNSLLLLLVAGCGLKPDWETHYRGVEIQGSDCTNGADYYIPIAKDAIDRVLDYYGLDKFVARLGLHAEGNMRTFCGVAAIPEYCEMYPYDMPQAMVLCDGRGGIAHHTIQEDMEVPLVKWVMWYLAGKDVDGFSGDAKCNNAQVFYDLGLECVFPVQEFIAYNCGQAKAKECQL